MRRAVYRIKIQTQSYRIAVSAAETAAAIGPNPRHHFQRQHIHRPIERLCRERLESHHTFQRVVRIAGNALDAVRFTRSDQRAILVNLGAQVKACERAP